LLVSPGSQVAKLDQPIELAIDDADGSGSDAASAVPLVTAHAREARGANV
jgi:hypothetical protein